MQQLTIKIHLKFKFCFFLKTHNMNPMFFSVFCKFYCISQKM